MLIATPLFQNKITNIPRPPNPPAPTPPTSTRLNPICGVTQGYGRFRCIWFLERRRTIRLPRCSAHRIAMCNLRRNQTTCHVVYRHGRSHGNALERGHGRRAHLHHCHRAIRCHKNLNVCWEREIQEYV